MDQCCAGTLCRLCVNAPIAPQPLCSGRRSDPCSPTHRVATLRKRVQQDDAVPEAPNITTRSDLSAAMSASKAGFKRHMATFNIAAKLTQAS